MSRFGAFRPRRTAAAPTRAGTSAKRDGQSFEDLFELAIAPLKHVCFARAHPEVKVIRDSSGAQRVIFVKKNGVDFVGSVSGRAVAIEAKRLPNAASLYGSKNDSTIAEAKFLLRFAAGGGAAAFVVWDPDRERLYVVRARCVEEIAVGGRVPLRSRDGTPQIPCIAAMPGGPVAQIRQALAVLAASSTPDTPHD